MNNTGVSGLVYYDNVVVYNFFCKDKKCSYYHEYVVHEWVPGYRCLLFKKETYDITRIHKNCPYKKQAKTYKEECHKKVMWEKLSG